MYIIRSIAIKTSFLLHKNLPGLILGGYIYRYTPRRYGPIDYLLCRSATEDEVNIVDRGWDQSRSGRTITYSATNLAQCTYVIKALLYINQITNHHQQYSKIRHSMTHSSIYLMRISATKGWMQLLSIYHTTPDWCVWQYEHSRSSPELHSTQ